MAGGTVSDGKRFDVLGLGIVTVDDFLYVDRYPSPDEKVRVSRRLRQCGGLTGTALVAAARLGARVAYAGVLGDDELSAFIRVTFEREGIDVSRVNPAVNRPPIHSTIIVDESAATRTIFFEADASLGAEGDWPPEDVVRSARVLFIDHKNDDVMIRAARVAAAASIPVVADFERAEAPRFRELLNLADHLIIGERFAHEITGEHEPARVFDALLGVDSSSGRVAVITRGEKGCVARGGFRGENSDVQIPAFEVAVADTTGCGDVFHGAYAAALAFGMPLEIRLKFASAAAALKAMHHGGQAGIPSRNAVEALLRERT